MVINERRYLFLDKSFGFEKVIVRFAAEFIRISREVNVFAGGCLFLLGFWDV